MKQTMAVALAILLAVGCAEKVSTHGPSSSAVQKVIQLLGDMAANGKKAMNEEQIAFAEFSTWCSTEKDKLSNQIKSETEQIETLSASISKLTSDATALANEVAELQASVDKNTADIKAQTEQRAKDHKDFLAESQDYSESVDALERAIAVLQKQNFDRTGAASALLQLTQGNQLPENAKTMMAAFIGMMNDSDAKSEGDFSPEANAYEFQSTGIIDLLKKLKADFTAKLSDCEKEEMNSRHAHDMLVQNLKDSVEDANEDIGEKTSTKDRKLEEAALAKKDLASTSALKADDEAALSDTKAECAEKKLSFDEKQQLRSEEIQAIEKAIEILSSDEVSGSASTYLGLAQKKKATSLLQLDGRGASRALSQGIRHRLRDFLTQEGKRLHSTNLGLLAEKIAADPFAKVKKLIDDMITRLLNEANEDASHEGFCDKELGESKITREKLTKDIDALSAAVDAGKATITQLGQEIAELNAAVAALDASMKEATELRTAEKEKNAATVKDATEALNALTAAVAVLKDFYKKASTATGFVQTSADPNYADWGVKETVQMDSDNWDALANPNFEGTVDKGHKEGMQTFGAVYKGMQSQAGGVLAMLEVIQSDFSELKADTEAGEAEGDRTYTQFMRDSEKDKAAKQKKIEMDTNDKVSAESQLRDDTADMKLNQDKLLAADRYYEKLVPQCIDKGMTFDERTKARQSEIASLKEALRILGGTTE